MFTSSRVKIFSVFRNGAQTHFADQHGKTVFHIAAKSHNPRYSIATSYNAKCVSVGILP